MAGRSLITLPSCMQAKRGPEHIGKCGVRQRSLHWRPSGWTRALSFRCDASRCGCHLQTCRLPCAVGNQIVTLQHLKLSCDLQVMLAHLAHPQNAVKMSTDSICPWPRNQPTLKIQWTSSPPLLSVPQTLSVCPIGLAHMTVVTLPLNFVRRDYTQSPGATMNGHSYSQGKSNTD